MTPVEETAAELRRLMEKATPGEWTNECDPDHCRTCILGAGHEFGKYDGYVADTCSKREDEDLDNANSAFIVAARNSLPAILDELDRLRAERDELAEALWQDESGQFHALLEIKQRLRQSEWLLESRGPYEWDDDRYKDEAGTAFRDIEKIIAPIEKKTRSRMVVGGKRFDGIGVPLRAAVARAEAAEAELARLGRVEAAAREVSAARDESKAYKFSEETWDEFERITLRCAAALEALDAALAEMPK